MPPRCSNNQAETAHVSASLPPRTSVTKTFDALTLGCSPRYVSTLLGSNLSSAGVKLLCSKSSAHPEKEPAASKPNSSSAQGTSSESEKETPASTPVETISPITSSSTTKKPGNPASPVISKGPPPDLVTLQPAATPATTTTPTTTSSESSSSEPPTSTSSESATTTSSSLLTSSSTTQKATPKPAGGPITTTSSSVSSSTRLPSSSSTQPAKTTTALPAGAISNEEPKKHRKSSTGPIVGGILGGVAFIILLIIFAFFFVIRPQRRRQEEEDEDYNQKTATTKNATTLTSNTTPPKDPIYSAANPYPNQNPTLPNLVTKTPYRSNSQRSGVSELIRHDSRPSMRSVNRSRSNSMSDRYDVSPIDRYGNPMWDPYGPPDRYGPYVAPPMDDRYGPYSASPMNTHRYDPTGVSPISYMEAEWNQLRGQQPMRQNSHSKSRANFINYPSVIEEERESVSAASGPGSVYELGNDGNGSKTSVRRSEDNKGGGSAGRSEDKMRTGTPDVTRKSPLRVVNGAPEN
ncbi:hypothetical protein EG327_008363 [Venturia inaequalis]|uniref:Uncharacterized protein n=1 Tax=Venturia inaequalis TaxID=5025 RepID=A0A8H3ZAS9_VENIN|nr:hypothetical protein EG327_008363 [Venturia inaequalis]